MHTEVHVGEIFVWWGTRCGVQSWEQSARGPGGIRRTSKNETLSKLGQFYLLVAHTHTYIYMYICGLGQNSSLTVFNAEHVWVSIFEVQSPGVSNQMGQLVESWRAIMQAVLGISHEFPWIPMITRVVMIEPTLTGAPYRRSKNIWIHANQQG